MIPNTLSYFFREKGDFLPRRRKNRVCVRLRGLEDPVHRRIPAEPRQLPLGIVARALLAERRRLGERGLAAQIGEKLFVADGLGGGAEDIPVAPDPLGLLQDARIHHPADPQVNAAVEHIPVPAGQAQAEGAIGRRPEINGRKLSSLRLRNLYGINISRVHRSGVQLLATPDLTLQLGDSLTVVGEAQAIEGVEKILGNAVKQLDEPNLIPVFIGLLLGLLLGSIPFAVPGISLPVKLGLAGGPIILGILIGTFGPRIHIVTYTTLSANLMLRALGLSLYLACLGLEAGAHFVETIMRPEGMLWIGLGFLLTFVPIVIVAALSLRFFKLDFGQVAGIMCGSMANPMALNYANDSIPGDHPAVAYATVYPVCMFLRVIIIQILIMCFI